MLKTLTLVQRAKSLFETQNGSETPKKRRDFRVANTLPKPVGKRGKGAKQETHASRIIEVLKQNKGAMPSGEIIDALLKKQNKVKDIKRFRTLIYPTLTQAYKKKVLKLKDGKVYLTA